MTAQKTEILEDLEVMSCARGIAPLHSCAVWSGDLYSVVAPHIPDTVFALLIKLH